MLFINKPLEMVIHKQNIPNLHDFKWYSGYSTRCMSNRITINYFFYYVRTDTIFSQCPEAIDNT